MSLRWAWVTTALVTALAMAQEPSDFDRLRALHREGAVAEAESTAVALAASHRAAARLADAARCFEFLANLHLEQARLGEARAEADSMLALYRKAKPQDELRIAASLHLLGLVARRQAEYTQARAFYEESLAMRERLLGSEHVDVAWSLNNLANVYYELGDFRRTAELHRRALAIREKLLGPEHADVGFSLNNLANAMMELGDVEGAIPLLVRSLAIREKAHGAMHVNVAQSLNNLALAHGRLGRYGLADSLYARSVAIRESVLGSDHPEVARSLLRRSFTREALGDAKDALAMAQRALELRRASLGAEHPEVGLCHLRVAHVLARQGRPREAAEQARLAEGISRRHFARMARGLEERTALEYLGERSQGLDLLLELSGRQAQLDSLALDALIRSRTLVLQEMMTRQRLVAAASDRRTRTLASSVIERRAEVAKIALDGPGEDSEATFQARLALAESASENAERALARRSESFEGLVGARTIGLAEVRRALPRQSVLVCFARYAQLGAPTAEFHFAGERYVAFVLHAGRSNFMHIDLGDAAVIDRSAAAWYEQLRLSPNPLRRASAEQELRAAGLALRSLLFDPIVPQLESAQRIFLVPDATLALLPLLALPNDAGGYLIESPQSFHVLSAERELVEFAGKAKRGSGLLAVGGVEFGGPAMPCLPDASTALAPLPGSLREAESIVAFWQSSGEGPVQLLRGADATEARLRDLAPGRRVLHLATHGFFVDQNCPGQTLPPAYRGGIVLSPGEAAGAGGRDDGWLTAGEIAGLDWSGLECAVLSACRSGYGQVDATGEELLGLQRALRVAGAATIVTSLWEVEDGAAREWMSAFYDARWGRDLPLAEAMQTASQSVIRARRERGQSDHPSAWANFVAVGDWR